MFTYLQDHKEKKNEIRPVNVNTEKKSEKQKNNFVSFSSLN